MQFAHPFILWFIPLVLIPIIVWYVFQHRHMNPAMHVSTTVPFAQLGRPFKHYIRHAIFGMRLIALAALIVALARPVSHDSWRESTTEGTDIVLAMDISTSMLARDFDPDRLGAAKQVATQFVNGRENDNMGLVIFAGESLTGVPMTTDRATLTNYIESLNFNMLEDGTAIGDGLATAINRIKDGQAKSKSIILLTDGSNNTGNVAPLTAAEIAHQLGIKVYTIGIGTNGNAMMPTIDYFGRMTYTPQPVVIDEATLQEISQMTGGRYFRATDNKVLKQVFDEIDTLEKTVIDVRNFSHTEDSPLTFWLIGLALALVALDILLRHTVMRSIP
ncbi:MAG: VWA domain-containing protein [Muribaculaceae bacterium]|nr:VWA domain-containing protein [Muribaculaceae bacterium]